AAAGLAFAAAEAAGEPMPLRLREKILEQGRTCVASREPAAAPLREPGKRDRGVFDTRYLGWYAAAAMLVLALWSPWSSKPGKAG
ncbi:MAG: hypothetical protein GTO30_07565, partial [Acidobacteria bacterium]|nr:hypothetical protein [Acidobacteriota bacterium]